LIERRPPRARPLAVAAVALVVGILAGLGGATPFPVWVAALAMPVVALAALWLDSRDVLIAAALLGIVTGGALIGERSRETARHDCRATWQAGARVRLAGIALGYLPAGEQGSVRLRPASAARASACVWAGALRVYAHGPVRPGGLYELSGSWQPARTPGRGLRPPERRGWVVAQEFSLVGPPKAARHPFLAARSALGEKLWHAYPRRWAPLAQALVLGQREMLSPEVTGRIARAGLAHLLAISGLHVGMLAAAIFGLARVARLPAERAHLVTIGLTWGYVLLIGAPASAVRAALMVMFWGLARLAGRASSPFDVLGLAALLLLLVRPWDVVQPGFQLSFAGAAAVGYAHTEARRSPWLRERPAAVRAVVLSLLTSSAAVLLTAPITATYFGRVAPAAILGNLAAIPLLSLAMPALFSSAVLSPWPWAASWPAGAAVVLLRTLDSLARLLSGMRWASFDVASPGLLAALAYVLLLVLAVHALHGAWQRRRFIVALGAVAAGAIAGPTIDARLAPERLAVYVLDVGQGDAIAIATPHRHWLLVDAGPRSEGFDAGERRVLPFLREQGVRRLEAWLPSHADLDHVGGGPAVLDALAVERVIGSGSVTGQAGQVAVLQHLAQGSSRWLRVTAGASFGMDGVELIFLHPDSVALRAHAGSSNELSVVFLLEFGAFRMLFTGDVPASVEDQLSQRHRRDLEAQVLKVSHHGSTTSTSQLLLATVRPQLAVISVGRVNRYGHPAPLVIARLAAHGVQVRRTDRDGTLVIEAARDGSWRVRSGAEGF